MLTRRTILLGGSAAAVGLGAKIVFSNVEADAPWSELKDGAKVAVNGITYEAECGRKAVALMRAKADVFRFSMVRDNLWENDDPDDSERTELDGWRGRIATTNTPLWASWSMLYEPGPWSTSDWCILRQIYARYTASGRPWSVLSLKPGGELHWVGGNADDPKDFWPLRHTQRIPQGEWLHFVETYKFDPHGRNGYWKSWLNGRQVLDHKGAVGKGGVTSHYAKFGIYRSRTTGAGGPVTELVNVRHANMRFTTDDLSHLIGHPEAISE